MDSREEKKLKAQRDENALAKHKGDFYGRGLALSLESKATGVIVDASKNKLTTVHLVGKRATPTQCRCGLMDHLRISFGKCKLNPKNIALCAKAAEEEAAKKA